MTPNSWQQYMGEALPSRARRCAEVIVNDWTKEITQQVFNVTRNPGETDDEFVERILGYKDFEVDE